MFLLSDGPHNSQEASSTEGTTDVENSFDPDLPAQPNTTPGGENEDTEVSGVASIPQTMSAGPSGTLIPAGGQLPAAAFQSPNSDPGNSGPPQIFQPLMLVSPQQIFQPPTSIASVGNGVVTIPPIIPGSPLVAPSSVLESSQIAVLPTTPEPPYLVVSSPILAPSRTTIPHQVITSAMIPIPPPANSHFVLESLQLIAPTKTIDPTTGHNLPYAQAPPTTLASASDLPQAIHESQIVALHHPSGPSNGAVGDNLGVVVASENGYKLPCQTSAAATIRSRRNSIEGAPDITLTLSGSGYEFVTLSTQPTPSLTPPPSTHPYTVPASQGSLEDFPTIPIEIETDFSGVPPMDELVGHPSQRSHEEPSSTPASDCFHFAPRIIPDYSIDRSDLPSWFSERERLDYVLSVEAGDVWEKLITAWLRQERRLGFGTQVNRTFCPPLRNILMTLHRA